MDKRAMVLIGVFVFAVSLLVCGMALAQVTPGNAGALAEEALQESIQKGEEYSTKSPEEQAKFDAEPFDMGNPDDWIDETPDISKKN